MFSIFGAHLPMVKKLAQQIDIAIKIVLQLPSKQETSEQLEAEEKS